MCTVATRNTLQQKCLNKRIANAPREHDFATFNPYTDPLPSDSLPQKFEIVYLVIISRIPDHMTI